MKLKQANFEKETSETGSFRKRRSGADQIQTKDNSTKYKSEKGHFWQQKNIRQRTILKREHLKTRTAPKVLKKVHLEITHLERRIWRNQQINRGILTKNKSSKEQSQKRTTLERKSRKKGNPEQDKSEKGQNGKRNI